MSESMVEFFEVFPWNDNFETGIPEIDDQHKQLVHLLNQLAAHLAHQSDSIELNKVFGELAAYADHHFKTEEGIWRPYFKDDDWFINHEQTHNSFMENVVKLKEEEGTKPLDEVIEDILKFLTHWLAYHILDSDKRMAKAVLAVNSGLSLEQAKMHADHEMSGSMRLLIETVLGMYDSLSSRTLELMKEKTERKRFEKELQQAHDELEARVVERTEALAKSQEQLYQAQKMEAIGTLVGGIAHDFNNMLSGITGNLYLAKKRTLEMPDVAQRLASVEELAFRASEMIQQLLTFARKGDVTMVPLPLNSFVKETLKFLRTSIPENIEIHQSISSDSMKIVGNATQLHQVLMNLVNNACDAIEGAIDPSITIKLEEYYPDTAFIEMHPESSLTPYAHLSVEDNGGGIPEHQVKHLFEPFFTTKEQGKGTGLGLAMVFGAVKTHQGFIEVSSSIGKGSAFHIYIPIHKLVEIDYTASSENVAEGNGEMVLVVDDNEIVRKSTRDILESINYKVCEASNGLEAVDIIAANPNEIALVILDLVMPKLGGVEAARRIKEIQPEMKIILSTGYDKDEALKGELPSEGVSILSKPHSVDELSKVLRDQLDS
ncbi:bacteriohemerythrin [Mariprofundus sp. KV]|uniref:bacteriohemerythrin n=1 Tax=Mariprofundus sp. KV TaxID=2608715 RepID=UPI0015A25977|nr:bacteriohemerythrin [Mariprofundus sp. KV]NWF36917.1 bacteriohemerythrin [Mariprofundus sp. KV]